MLLGAEASRQSEGPFSAAQELLGLFPGGGVPFTRVGLPCILNQAQCRAHCPGAASPCESG